MNTIRQSNNTLPRDYNLPKQKPNVRNSSMTPASKPKVNAPDQRRKAEQIQKKQVKSHKKSESIPNSQKISAKKASRVRSHMGANIDMRA